MSKTKENPYKLTWFNADWTDKQTAKNNQNHWDWEMKYNGFIPPNVDLEKFEEYKKKITV